MRTLELDADAPACEDALWRLYRDEIDALLVRGVYRPEAMSRIYDALEAPPYASMLRQRDHHRESPQVQVLGLAIAPSDLYPGGPDLRAYLDAADAFRPLCTEIFAPEPPFFARMERVFAGMSGGRAVQNATADGRGYGPSTIRRVPPGADRASLSSGVYRPHCENLYLRIPAFDPVRERLDLVRMLSFFVTIGNAESGGELVIYPGVRWQEGTRAKFPDTEELLAGSADEPPSLRFAPAPGDAVVFAAGRVYHRVTPIAGPRPRWTVGGFGAFAWDGSGFHYWA